MPGEWRAANPREAEPVRRVEREAEEAPVARRQAASVAGAYYRNCDAARAAGAAPLYRGQAGYRPPLDADGDGVACEPFRGK